MIMISVRLVDLEEEEEEEGETVLGQMTVGIQTFSMMMTSNQDVDRLDSCRYGERFLM